MRHQTRTFALYGLLVIVAGAFGTQARGLLGHRSPDPVAEESVRARATAEADTSRELLLVYVGAAACPWSVAEDLPERFATAVRELGRQAQPAGYVVTTLGIARDSDAPVGLKHLDRFGDFAEVVAGRGWLNIAAQHYVLGEFGGVPATPQFLVVRRVVRGGLAPEVVSEELLIRKVGLSDIRRWTERGAPVVIDRRDAGAIDVQGSVRGRVEGHPVPGLGTIARAF